MHAIITGHSRGLGAAIAENLLVRGMPVLALARHGNADLSRRFPQTLREVTIDLADSAALARWLAGGALAAFLDGAESLTLINNAGVLAPVGPPGSQGAAAIAQAVAINVAAPLMLADAVVAASGSAHDRRLLHVSSGAARSAFAGWSIYCASKAALDHHARAVAEDRVPGLAVASLAPGVVDTGMQAEIRAVDLRRFPLKPRFEALKRDNQLASPGDCAARLVDFLLADSFGRQPTVDLRDL